MPGIRVPLRIQRISYISSREYIFLEVFYVARSMQYLIYIFLYK